MRGPGRSEGIQSLQVETLRNPSGRSSSSVLPDLAAATGLHREDGVDSKLLQMLGFGEIRVLANIRNGLPYPHDGVCMFLSSYGHSKKLGYFRLDSMPLGEIIYLLKGGKVRIVDATSNRKSLTDAQRFGVTTFCLAFNRGLRKKVQVAPYQTRDMVEAADDDVHRRFVATIRRLAAIYGNPSPLVIGEQIELECHPCDWDDKPDMIKWMVK